MPDIVKYGIELLIFAILALAFGVAAGRTASVASAGFARNLRGAMYDHVQEFSFANIDKFSTASIVTRLTTDVSNVQMAFQMCTRIATRAPVCNFICSLRPDEEKLAFSVIFNMNEKGEVKDSRIVHTIIKSDRRFTYEEAQKVIETGEGDYKEEILELNKLAQILRKQRLAAGAIDFDSIEVKFEIDETGKPLSVYFKESKEANKLIEEFMLLANRTVAERIGKVPKNKKAKVFPYRIHDLPDPDKLENLNWFINRFGYKIRTSGSKTEISKSINRLLDDIKNKKEQNLVETVSLRAMQKARYSTHNIGHYGLAFDYYTHFTSPIRRFPDMMVHRLLTRYLAGGRTVQETKYEELCDHSSEMEQIAALPFL